MVCAECRDRSLWMSVMFFYFSRYKEAIEDITMRMGAGMAKFIYKEVCNKYYINEKGSKLWTLYLFPFCVNMNCLDLSSFPVSCHFLSRPPLTKNMKVVLVSLKRKYTSYSLVFYLRQVESIDDYDEYCHHVAGLVGLGLSKLFHASGKEDVASDSLCNSMGLFLQVLILTCMAATRNLIIFECFLQ